MCTTGVHTNVMSALPPKTDVWQNVNPNWLSSQKILVLSGIFSNQTGRLEYGGRESSDACDLCERLDGTISSEMGNWHRIWSDLIDKQLVLHRTFKYQALRPRHPRLHWDGPTSLELVHPVSRQC